MPQKPYATPTPTAKVSNPFGATQYRAPGMTGNLPASNVGVDWAEAAGAPVQAPVSGTVVTAYDAKSDRDPNENYGWGGSIVIKGDDGSTHRLSHLQRGSLSVQPGQRVEMGQRVAAVGATGNATGPHVDHEARDAQGRLFDPVPLSRSIPVATGTKSNTIRTYEQQVAAARAEVERLRRDRDTGLAASRQNPPNLPRDHPIYKQWEEREGRGLAYEDPDDPLYKALQAAEKRLNDAQAKLAQALDADSKTTATGSTRTPEQTRIDTANADRLEEDLAEARRRRAALADPNSPEGRQIALQIQQLETQVAAARSRLAQDEAAFPLQLQGQQLGNQRTAQQLGQDAALFPGQLQAQQLGNQRTQQQLSQEEQTFPLRLEQLGQQIGLTAQQISALQQKLPLELEQMGLSVETGRANLQRQQALTPGEVELQRLQIQRLRDPQFQDPGAAYQFQVAKAQQEATQKTRELLARVTSGELDSTQAREEFQNWWQQSVDAPLAGYRAQMERQQWVDQNAIDAAQRQENQRAETINRQRETLGLQAGTQMREQAAALTPNVRSNAFLGNVAQMANAWASGKPAQGVNFTPESFRPDPGQIPNMDAIAEIEAAKVLAHISPAAAARLGRPMPQFPALPDIEQFIPPYGA